MMGMELQFGSAVTSAMPIRLMGRLIYGLITGLACVWYIHR